MGPHEDDGQPRLVVNRIIARELHLAPGATVTLRGACTDSSSVPPTLFHMSGIAEFPFDQASQLTAVTSLRSFARACGDAARDEADMLMIASRPGAGPDR